MADTPGVSSHLSVRSAEVIAALSVATDLATGQPVETALSSCVLAMRLAEQLGLSDADLHAVYFEALLRFVGCNGDIGTFAALVGDEIQLRRNVAPIDTSSPMEVVRAIVTTVQQAYAGVSTHQLAWYITRALARGQGVMKEGLEAHCEAAQRLGARLGLDSRVIEALGQLYERWDGKGIPRGLKGEQVSVAVRAVTLAQDALLFTRMADLDAAVQIVRRRRGTIYDPNMVDVFVAHANPLFSGLDDEAAWEQVLAMEPGRTAVLSAGRFDEACQAIADFTDLKSPYLLGHSTRVSALAAAAAERAGLPSDDCIALRRAGLLHDVGRVGVSAGIWGKAGPLTSRDWDQVYQHPYYTERVLARSATLAKLGELAGTHHERLDGSGYHRRIPASLLGPSARILAAADAYCAMTEPRPYRDAMSPGEAAAELQKLGRSGKLDPEAIRSVLDAAGLKVTSGRAKLVAGLSTREVEILRLIARGRSTRQVADELVISAKTVDNHIQHVYTKINVSTRAGAALFAMEHNLLDEEPE